jgi:polysaccharide biosynthesis transport protein
MKNEDSMIHFEGDPQESGLVFDSSGRPAQYDYAAAVRRVRLRRYLRAIRRHMWGIAGFALLVTALVVIFEAQQPEYYRSTARIEINPDTSPALMLGRGLAPTGLATYDPLYFSSQLQIIEGPGLLRRVVRNLDLERDRAFVDPFHGEKPTIGENVARMFGLSKKAGRRDASAPSDDVPAVEVEREYVNDVVDQTEIEQLTPYVSALRSGLTVTPVKEKRLSFKETRLVDITFTHYDRQVAAKIANAIADTYLAMNLEKKTRNGVTTGDFLQKRIEGLKSEIRAGEARLIDYARDNQIVSLDASQNTVVQRLADLNAKLAQAENDRITAEAVYRSSGSPAAAGAEVDRGDARAGALETRLNELRQRREQLAVEFMDEAPEIVEVDRQIQQVAQTLEATRKRAVGDIAIGLETKFREAAARERELRQAFEVQRDEVLAQNEASINYRIVQQEIDTNKKLLEGLLQRSRENDVVLSGTPNNVLLVDRALTPRSPAGPERLQYIALAFLAALAAGVGLAVLRGRSDDSLQTPEDVEVGLLMPVLSEIPSARQSRKLLPLPSILRRGDATRELAVLATDLKLHPAAKEAYLHLRTNILAAGTPGTSAVLLVASGRPAEGKTTTAVNLAKVLAETGERVLLVDADLRHPMLGDVFGFENQVGLSDLLTDDLSPLTIKDALRYDTDSRLYVLLAGQPSVNPATLLCSGRMRELLAFLREHFAYVIIDSPPALLFTDASVLSTLADAVLLVVRSGRSSQEVVSRARNMLQDRGAQLYGVVLNDAERPKDAYGYEARGAQSEARA